MKLILFWSFYMINPNESPALAEYTLLLATTQTRAQDPALAILPNPNLYPYLAVFRKCYYTYWNAYFNEVLINSY